MNNPDCTVQLKLDNSLLLSDSNQKGWNNNATAVHPIPSSTTTQENEHIQIESRETLSLESMSFCSRFETCSAPKCPLDILIEMRTDTDKDLKCGMSKATRHKYWQSLPENIRNLLPYEGYFSSEYNRIKAARDRWESMAQEEKDRIIRQGRERLSKTRGGK